MNCLLAVAFAANASGDTQEKPIGSNCCHLGCFFNALIDRELTSKG
jgi:hypothetical protein